MDDPFYPEDHSRLAHFRSLSLVGKAKYVAFWTACILLAIWIVWWTPPSVILREPNDDPYAKWVILIGKFKKLFFPWNWRRK